MNEAEHLSNRAAAAVETKLAAARTRLVLDKPFLGALALRLPMKAADTQWCPTTATDARAFYYNPDYIEGLSLDQTQFMLAHEALHCALSHFARRQHRARHKWDLACDYAINALLIEDGLAPPPNALQKPRFKGLTAEEIYPLIDDDDDSETLDVHAYDRDNEKGQGQQGLSEADLATKPSSSQEPDETRQDGSSGGKPSPEPADPSGAAAQPRPMAPDERETLSVQWRQRLAGAAQQAIRTGKLSGELARQIDHLLQPQLPWRMLLARYLTGVARDDYSYQRLSRREGDFILPSLRSEQLELFVAVDTSGSIKDGELADFIGEIDAIKGQVRARVTLLPCDSALCEGAPYRFEPWEALDLPSGIQGGGGTSFRPVFEWIERQDLRPDLVVYFTDAEGDAPAQAPPYPVIWLVKGRAAIPWGDRIQLN